jgi:hypothetical protein
MNLSTKNRILGHSAFFVLLALVNIIAFAAPLERNTGFWISYTFSSFAIALADALTFYALGGRGARGRFLGLPLIYVVWLYLGLQFTLGLVFMAAPNLRALAPSMPAVPAWLILVASVLLLSLFLLFLIAAELGNTEIRRLDLETREKTLPFKLLLTELEGLAAGAADPDLKKELSAFAEEMRFSDPGSDPQLADLEKALAEKISLLGVKTAAGDTEAAKSLCAESRLLLAGRNRKCLLLKNGGDF